jgi:hypothetical protein
MNLDIVHLSWHRPEFSEASLAALLANTDWRQVREVVLYDDTPKPLREVRAVAERISERLPCRVVHTNYRSPVRTMNDYLDQEVLPEAFVKLDSDIVVPPGWLQRMVSVMERNPALELLGFEAGQSGMVAPPKPQSLRPEAYTWVEARHIGGVGLMRIQAFLDRPRMRPAGRYGFTEWQHRHRPVVGWIAPDLHVCDLSRIPVQPWQHLSHDYLGRGWQRQWPQDAHDPRYWEWWTKEAA